MNMWWDPGIPHKLHLEKFYLFIYLFRACMILSDIVCLRIGRASPSALSRCSSKLSLFDSNIACVTLGKNDCLLPSSTKSNL